MTLINAPQPLRGQRLSGRELTLRRGRTELVGKVVDQAQVQVPAQRAPVGSLDPGRDDVRVARGDDALGLQPVQARAHCPLGQAGIADQRGHGRER
ncbi:MAG: hypothetical protein ACLPKE_28535, partial [Streptosporangiaceae bacterium]